jgi:hypothetical protein
MIQLDKSINLNSFAFYPDVEVSASIEEIIVTHLIEFNGQE